MAEDRSSRHLRIPRIGTIVLAIATLAAAGMLVASHLMRMTPQRALEHGDPVDRVQAVEELIKLGRNGVPELVHALKNYSRDARISALYGLGRIGPRANDAIDSVREALADRDPTIRSAAIATFWQIHRDPVGAVPILTSMLADPNGGVRDSVEKTLEEIGLCDMQPLVDAILCESDQIRIRVWSVVLKISKTRTMPEIVEAVRGMLDHSNPAIRDEALFIIVSWGQASVAEIRKLLRIGEIRLAFSLASISGFSNVPLHQLPAENTGMAAVDVALQAMIMCGPEVVEFLPEILDLLDRQEAVETRMHWIWLKFPEDDFVIHYRMETLLQVLSKMQTAARSAVPSLVRRMNELHPMNRIPVAETLLDIGGEPDMIVPILVPLLSERVRDHSGPESMSLGRFQWEAQRAAILLTKVSPEEARHQISLLIPKLGTVETGINKTTLMLLAGLGAVAQESVAVVVGPLVGHSDREIRGLAIETLSRMGSEAAPAVQELIEQLERYATARDPESSRRIVKAFGQIGPSAKRAVPSLLNVIDDPNKYVLNVVPSIITGESGLSAGTMHWSELLRLTAISSLGKIGDASPEVLSVLYHQLKAALPERRVAAVKALRLANKISDPHLDELLPMLRDGIPTVRVQAALTIGNLTGRRKGAVTAIEELLSDKNLYVRQAAIMALGRIGTDAKSALPHLKALQREQGHMDPAWYARMTGINQVPSWFDETPDFQERTIDQSVKDAIAAIDPESN